MKKKDSQKKMELLNFNEKMQAAFGFAQVR
jgi:hypothetical protein